MSSDPPKKIIALPSMKVNSLTTKPIPRAVQGSLKEEGHIRLPYIDMISTAIATMRTRRGCSRQSILKFVVENFDVNPKVAATHVKMALRRGVTSGRLTQVSGTGAVGSFKLPMVQLIARKQMAKRRRMKKTKKAPKKAKKAPKKAKKTKKRMKAPAKKGRKGKTSKKAPKRKAHKRKAPKKKVPKKKAKKTIKPRAKKMGNRKRDDVDQDVRKKAAMPPPDESQQ